MLIFLHTTFAGIHEHPHDAKFLHMCISVFLCMSLVLVR